MFTLSKQNKQNLLEAEFHQTIFGDSPEKAPTTGLVKFEELLGGARQQTGSTAFVRLFSTFVYFLCIFKCALKRSTGLVRAPGQHTVSTLLYRYSY